MSDPKKDESAESQAAKHEQDSADKQEAYAKNDDPLMESPDDRPDAPPAVDADDVARAKDAGEHHADDTQKERPDLLESERGDPTQESVKPPREDLSEAAAEDELFGVVAEFGEVEEIREASRRTRDAGYTSIEAYVPFPIEDLPEDLGHAPTRLGWVVLLAGITGALVGFFVQLYSNGVFYPLNIGGKPLNSWPNFIVITFECTVLFSAFTAGLFMLGRNGLPRPYHPIFNTPGFENATRDKFFLCIEAKDPQFELDETRDFLAALNPIRVSEVDY